MDARQISANNRRRKDVHAIPPEDRELIDSLGWRSKLEAVDEAIQANAQFLREVVADPAIFVGNDSEFHSGQDEELEDDPDHRQTHPNSQPMHEHMHDQPRVPGPRFKPRYRPSEHDMDKLRSTLKQFVRDWSDAGRHEREACYSPMMNALEDHFKVVSDKSGIRVLVPGAGLGRLAFDVANRGYTCQGNEFSHYMLLPSHYILNRTQCIDQHTIFPYIHSFSNLRDRSALLQSVKIPDVLPSDLSPNSDFSLVAGDFEEIYGAVEDNPLGHESQVKKWDAVLTCFFIDTAKNIVNYLRIIHRILAPGGIWINLGPLLWHWENNTSSDPSIELDLTEVKQLAQKLGFVVSDEKEIETSYTTNGDSMVEYKYHAAFWTATKQ